MSDAGILFFFDLVLPVLIVVWDLQQNVLSEDKKRLLLHLDNDRNVVQIVLVNGVIIRHICL